MTSWRHEELERLRKEYNFYKDTEILDECTGRLRSESLKMIIDYHERSLGIKFWGDEIVDQNGDNSRHQEAD